jgi:nickel-type superoxide dismutase maturation protease
MNRKTARRLLRLISRFPGAYSAVAFICARRATVRGLSMSPALLPGERLLFDRLAYARGRPRRGDAVLLAHPERPGLRLVKRLTALPGDTVAAGTLGPGQYWVTGDNADASTDSRKFGPVRRDHLLGRAWVRYWPSEQWEVWP